MKTNTWLRPTAFAIALIGLTACSNDDKATTDTDNATPATSDKTLTVVTLGRLPMLTLARQALSISVWVLAKPW